MLDESAVEQIRLQAFRDALEQRLGELVPKRGGRLADAMRYALLTPGKRLRPVLTLLTAWRMGAGETAALDPACAIEMVHTASLILDDLPCMDDARLRRGAQATHVRFGEEVAVLAAIGMLNQAYAILAETPGVLPGARVEMIRALTSAVGFEGLVAGQERDLRRETLVSLDGISELHHRKTAVLFLAAVRLGALVADAPERETAALSRFATELGLAFQAADDVSDETEDGAGPVRPTLLALLDRDEARREAADRLHAAKSALKRGGSATASLTPYVDVLLQVA